MSCFFDVVLLVQHYCLYGQNNSTIIRDSAADEPQNDSAFQPIISRNRLNSRDAGDAFSPMESAVLYHAPKGDLMISTASFKDVFSRDVNASQVRIYQIEETKRMRDHL